MLPSVIQLLLAAVWLLLFRYCQIHSYADPTSYFFDEQRALALEYTAVREREAEDFLEFAATATRNDTGVGVPTSNRICLGIPSVRREREQFFARTIASLVDSIGAQERQLLYIVVLLADEDPQLNPAYGQQWVDYIADEVLVYADPAGPPGGSSRYRRLEAKQAALTRDQHMRLDYANLMDACVARDSDYFVLLEDDVMTSRDWLARLRGALAQMAAATGRRDWLYLRLFHAEMYLGWNAEEWPSYLAHALVVYLAAGTVALLLRRRATGGAPLRLVKAGRLQSRPLMALLRFNFWFCAFTLLYFKAGRITVGRYGEGVHEMDKYGCCAQGLAFPSRHLQTLSSAFRATERDLPVDSLIEAVADERGLGRWMMVPSVLQHVGARGSSAAGGSLKTTLNYSFERQHSS
ncbi:hypothetical protein CDD83_2539 [Cordyceps sp. RAO-2017]|nr:hypothetical protein CDD83_2539 [Cordyceps sp. RAO-2017]